MLPKIPHKQTKRTQEIVAFRGLNRTQNTQDGDILNAEGLSTAEYPTVTQRGKRTLVPKYINPQDPTDIEYYSDPTDIYAWDGHLIVVDSGILYLDGAPMINVSQGKKQFAVINTKLCIWPDKLYIDLAVTGADVPGGTIITNGDTNNVTITGNSFTASITPMIAQNQTYRIESHYRYMYTYGASVSAFLHCWHDGAWDMNALSEMQSRDGTEYTKGKIFVPGIDNGHYYPVTAYSDRNIDTSQYNTMGYFAVVTDVKIQTDQYYYYYVTLTFDVYSSTQTAPLFSTVFQVGDGVSFAGMPTGADLSYALIRAIDNATNTMSFDDNTFSVSGTFSNVVTIRRVANTGFGHLDAVVETTGEANSIEITSTTFTAVLSERVSADVVNTFNNQTNPGEWSTYDIVYTYGSSRAAVEACYQNSAWDLTALAAIQVSRNIESGGTISAGDIFIPQKQGNAFNAVAARNNHYNEYTTYPDRSLYNTEGYYAVVTDIQTVQTTDPYGMVYYYTTTVTFDVYRVDSGEQSFSEIFKVGDAVSITGTKDGTANVDHAIIRAIATATNTLTFDAGTFSVPAGYDTSEYVVTIQRAIPQLDYICEKDNRLWGVSNSLANSVYNPGSDSYETYTARAIYASALGDPTNWWVFDGVDSDSFQVAVGSEGDFTGICAYGNAVCCWKEDTLHKILGSFPSEYYMHTSHIEGVAKGSSRSLTLVNEVLYYNGATGIYAYTGSTPSLIGYPLGTLYKDVSAGSNGLRWYFSGTKPDGEKELVVYDLTHRIWTREDDSDAVAFAMIGSNLYILNHYDDTFNRIWLVEQGGDPDVEWSAEFVPFDETELIRKHYLRIALRLDMAAGSHVTVEVSMDNGEWRTLLEEDAEAAKAKVVQIPPNRVDRFTVRVSGTGNVRIREFMREYIPGSERV